jgi:hypothetical protein
MSKTLDTPEQRKLRAVARRYRRDGYRVIIPGRGGVLPTFLKGFTPDLIAESPDDRVIVEIKQSHSLRGSNYLEEVAERVSREPGWRLELVTIPSVATVLLPTEDHMKRIAGRAQQALESGFADAAYAYAWLFLEVLLCDMAAQHRLEARKKPILQLARELASKGVISRDALDSIEQSREIRNELVHAENESQPSAEHVQKLLSLAEGLRIGLSSAEAA